MLKVVILMIDTLKSIILQFVGSYEVNPDIFGLAGLDWPWLFGGVLLLVLVWCGFWLIKKFIEVIF